MLEKYELVKSFDNFVLKVYVYGQFDNIRGIIQIVHGKGEHHLNYSTIISRFVKEGYIVYIHDHRGHGEYNKGKEAYDFVSKENVFDVLVRDVHYINSYIRQKHDNHKIILYGHSMGGFLGLDYVENYDIFFDILILSGIGVLSYFKLYIVKGLSYILKCFKGDNFNSLFLDKLLKQSINKRHNSEYGFISTDEIVYKEYIEDSLRVRKYNLKFYFDMFSKLNRIFRLNNINRIKKELPIILFAGEEDSICNYKKGVLKLFNLFKKSNILNVECRIYKKTRHEVFKENSKHKAFKDLFEFLEKN